MRSLAPNFRKKRFSCFWGQITHTRKKSILSMFAPHFRDRVELPKKKYQLQSGLNQRDRATAGCGRDRSHGKPSNFFYCRGFSYVHHLLRRPSTSENNFLSRILAEPAADARPCCARAPAHHLHVAARRPRSELFTFTWQRLRCPKGSCIGKRGEGRWWVRLPANSRTSFSEGQKDYRKFGIMLR